MKIGDKLYWLILWEDWGKHKFQIRTKTITKINKKTVEVWGWERKISKLDIGYKFFTSKKRMYQYHIRQHKEYVKPTLQAIKNLEKRLRNCHE